jgi:hypothetical protein
LEIVPHNSEQLCPYFPFLYLIRKMYSTKKQIQPPFTLQKTYHKFINCTQIPFKIQVNDFFCAEEEENKLTCLSMLEMGVHTFEQ